MHKSVLLLSFALASPALLAATEVKRFSAHGTSLLKTEEIDACLQKTLLTDNTLLFTPFNSGVKQEVAYQVKRTDDRSKDFAVYITRRKFDRYLSVMFIDKNDQHGKALARRLMDCGKNDNWNRQGGPLYDSQ